MSVISMILLSVGILTVISVVLFTIALCISSGLADKNSGYRESPKYNGKCLLNNNKECNHDECTDCPIYMQSKYMKGCSDDTNK